jgi:uncharacterized protein
MESESLKIAVVGSGVAGLTATHILQRKHDVTLFEKQGRLGGHTNTISVENGDGSATPVDTGFIVMNDRNYPLLTKLFRQLKVDLRDSDMSFSYYDVPGGLQYSTKGFNRLFAQRKNLLNPRFIRMILDILRFYKTGNKDLRGGDFRRNIAWRLFEAERFRPIFYRSSFDPNGISDLVNALR